MRATKRLARPLALIPLLAVLLLVSSADRALSQAVFTRGLDGWACVEAIACQDGDPPFCTDMEYVCTRFGEDGEDYRCIDQKMDVLCCDDESDCPRGRCVDGYPEGHSLCVRDTPAAGTDPGHLCGGADPAVLDLCYSTGGEGSPQTPQMRYGDGDCDRDNVPNVDDDCDCVHGLGEPGGCPPSLDGGMIDGGADVGAQNDAGSSADGRVALPDAAARTDASAGTMAGYRGGGGCACRASARPNRAGDLAAGIALLLLFATVRSR
jgi:hypothetical protein